MTSLTLSDLLFLMVFLVLPSLAIARVDDDPAALAPAPPPGWRIDGEDAFYDRETIFHYMDGAGEVYLSFDFRSLFVRNYAREGEEGIILELYDMGCAAEAYGIFSRSREAETSGIGNGYEFRSGYCVFWKGRWFVTLYTLRESDAANAAVLAMARAVADKIADAGAPPDLLRLLPVTNRVPASERYFHKYTDLNQHYFIADDDILALGADVEAVLALYTTGERRQYLLIIRYPDAARAGTAFDSFRAQFMNGAESVAQIEPGYWSAARLSGRYLLATFDAVDAAGATALIADISIPEEK